MIRKDEINTSPPSPTETVNIARYTSAMHAMQSGVAMEMNNRPEPTTPKHLRVGVNSALMETQMLARLLMRAGVFTREEYFAAMADMAEEEQANYEERLTGDMGGVSISLA